MWTAEDLSFFLPLQDLFPFLVEEKYKMRGEIEKHKYVAKVRLHSAVQSSQSETDGTAYFNHTILIPMLLAGYIV